MKVTCTIRSPQLAAGLSSPSSKRETEVSCAPTPTLASNASGWGFCFLSCRQSHPLPCPKCKWRGLFPLPLGFSDTHRVPCPSTPCVDTPAPPTFYTLLPDVRHPAPASPSPSPASAPLCAPLSSAPVAATRCVCTPGPCVCAVAPVNAPPVCLCPLPTDRHPRLPARPHRPLRLRACLHPLPLPRMRAEGFVLCTF